MTFQLIPLIDKMFIKRFCLPSNIDIHSAVYKEVMLPCICDRYNHVACVIDGNVFSSKMNILSFGINTFSIDDSAGIHAEYSAIQKLDLLPKKRRLKSVNLLVIRLSGNRKIQFSKPCAHCINMMKTYAPKKGYQIKHILYSDINGDIVKTNLWELEKEEKHYSTAYRKQKRHLSDS
jgi:cytidine deaminase